MPTSIPKRYKYLSDEQVDSFMRHGYLKVEGAFSKSRAEEFTKDVWTRLGMDPNDKSTWTREWTNMPSFNERLVEDFAPAAWGAMTELLGGAERISNKTKTWQDAFIVNLGTSERLPENANDPRVLDRWHCDGDSFLHFMDSPEQGLLVVPIFTDIVPGGGGTMIAPQGVDMITKFLADHPEGVQPRGFPIKQFRDACTHFVELTGNAGDVVLMHPFMLHSASRNVLRIPRIITNPIVSVKEPFNYFRSDPRQYSLVELKTLRCLGRTAEEGYDFRPTTQREVLFPERLKVWDEWRNEEAARLAARRAQITAASADGMASQPSPALIQPREIVA